MTKERVFQLKVGADGNFALKERAHKHINGEQTRLKVVFGLHTELRIVDPCLFINGAFVDSNVYASQRGLSLQDFLLACKRENTSVYYNLNSLTYICQQTVVKERGKIIKNSVSIFIPVNVTKAGLVCNEVTLSFPRQNRSVLADTYLNYTLSRL
jgi:hypothetical protein